MVKFGTLYCLTSHHNTKASKSVLHGRIWSAISHDVLHMEGLKEVIALCCMIK